MNQSSDTIFTVKADKFIKDLTIITEYVGDVDYLQTRENDDGVSIMTLISAANPSKSLVICPNKRNNIAQFINGINNLRRKKRNLKCVRYNVDGEARVLLVANREIAKGMGIILNHTLQRLPSDNKLRSNSDFRTWDTADRLAEKERGHAIMYSDIPIAAYNDMQQKIERLHAQLGDQKGKCKDTPCVSNTLDPLPQKLEKENVELEFQKVDKTNDLSNPVISNSVPTTRESKVVENDKVIAPGMLRINPFKSSREVKSVPNKPINASVRTSPITVPQPHVITQKAANSDSNGFSCTGVDITTKTRRPQPRINTKNDRVPSASKSSRIKNKEVEVEDHPRNLLLSKNKKHMSSECNNIKLYIRNDKSKIVFDMCKQCLIIANHDACALNYVNGMNSRSKKQKANVSNIANQTKHKAQIWKPKNVGFKERLASRKPSKPRMRLRWSPTGKMFDIKRKLIASSES
ncbi:hypothetical protein Tco_0930824, partial [Tanacetum coccineum]